MRTFINGAGTDSTSLVRDYLASHRQLLLCDLYVIRTAPCYAGQYLDQTFLLTDFEAPLKWDHKGTFQKAVISRGEVESKIGLEADSLDITWSPLDSQVLASGGSPLTTLLTVLQGFNAGIFDNGTVEVWRCVLPNPGDLIGSPAVAAKFGDANTFGACMMFGGRIGDIKPDRQSVTMTVISRMETLNIQVPTNLIEPTNILAQYLTGQLASAGPASAAVVAGSTVNKIYADGTGSPIITAPAGTYDSGYLRFSSGKLAGHFVGVRAQTIESGHHAFYLYGKLPFPPSVGDTLIPYIPIPRDFASASASANGYAGFPFVPNPTNSAVVIA
jgi:hypothetical protein